MRTGAARAVLADLALRAVVVHEKIEASDGEVQAEVERLAERVGEKPEKVRRDLDRRGALETVRSDLARGKALEFLVEHATVVDESGNEIDLTVPPPSDDSTTDDTSTTDISTTDTNDERERAEA